jgi:hypothetical protein
MSTVSDEHTKARTEAERRRIFAESDAKIDASRARLEEARRKFFAARDQLHALNGRAPR